MIAKLIVWAPTAIEALARLRRAIDEYRIAGVPTTLPFVARAAATTRRVAAGTYGTQTLEAFAATTLRSPNAGRGRALRGRRIRRRATSCASRSTIGSSRVRVLDRPRAHGAQQRPAPPRPRPTAPRNGRAAAHASGNDVRRADARRRRRGRRQGRRRGAQGDVVAVIEAMKMMNEIRAHRAGTVGARPGRARRDRRGAVAAADDRLARAGAVQTCGPAHRDGDRAVSSTSLVGVVYHLLPAVDGAATRTSRSRDPAMTMLAGGELIVASLGLRRRCSAIRVRLRPLYWICRRRPSRRRSRCPLSDRAPRLHSGDAEDSRADAAQRAARRHLRVGRAAPAGEPSGMTGDAHRAHAHDHTTSGIPLRVSYGPADAAEAGAEAPGEPGAFPFTRGIRARRVPRATVDDAPVRRLRHRRRIERALSLPARARHDRALGGVRSADATGLRLRRAAGARRGRQGRRRDRLRSPTWKRCSIRSRSTRSRSR